MANRADVPVRELNHNTAGVLARLEQGERINITERGAVIVRLVPARSQAFSESLNSGKLHPAGVSGPAPRPNGPIHTDLEAGRLIEHLRDAERY